MWNCPRENRPESRSCERFGAKHLKTVPERPLTGHGGLRYRQTSGSLFGGSGEFTVREIRCSRMAARRVEPRSENQNVPCNFEIAGDFFMHRPVGQKPAGGL